MEGKLKNPFKKVEYITHARIMEIQQLSAFLTRYRIIFYSTLYEDPESGEIREYGSRREDSESIEDLDPRFITMLRQGIVDSGFLDEANPALGGATPNQVLQQMNPKFVNHMKGLNLEFETITL